MVRNWSIVAGFEFGGRVLLPWPSAMSMNYFYSSGEMRSLSMFFEKAAMSSTN